MAQLVKRFLNKDRSPDSRLGSQSMAPTEKSKEQNWEDRGHRADMQAKRSEPPARKVTLIEVRENQQSQE
ncbi:hypothetical protein U0070_018997 [Myodes glareolus]|uniref:Uncharacterized protein n=1 Tax=Myodes glareolus TaxID=447135 RepID=A0AAW0H1Q5_MYOGA